MSDIAYANGIEIIVFACIGILLWLKLNQLVQAILLLAQRASRPLPSVAGQLGRPVQELSEPLPMGIHVPSSMLPWERVENEEE